MTRPASDLRVDIVINNHDYASYLSTAIESALAQSHPRVNVVAVDDGSGDESREILAGYEHQITAVLKDNGGQASALNAGLELCQGDVVMFLDADDVLHPDAAARVAAAFAADDRVCKVQFRMEVIDGSGQPTGTIMPADHLPMPNGDMREAELSQPFDLVWMATSANAFRLEPLRRILPIPEDAYPRTGADWYLVHLTALLGSVVSLDAVSASYRVHGANSYAAQADSIDLPQLRQSIEFAAATSDRLLRLARELGQPHPERILSIADLANRLVSLKLEPDRHPIPEDRLRGLVADSVRAIRRRSGTPAPINFAFVAWFATTALVPRRLAAPLAALFLFPGRRTRFNQLLQRLQSGTDNRDI